MDKTYLTLFYIFATHSPTQTPISSCWEQFSVQFLSQRPPDMWTIITSAIGQPILPILPTKSQPPGGILWELIFPLSAFMAKFETNSTNLAANVSETPLKAMQDDAPWWFMIKPNEQTKIKGSSPLQKRKVALGGGGGSPCLVQAPSKLTMLRWGPRWLMIFSSDIRAWVSLRRAVAGEERWRETVSQ